MTPRRMLLPLLLLVPALSGCRHASTGAPPSEVSRISMCSGASPRNGRPCVSASWRAPPWAKMSLRVPQCGQTK